jgi:hypothetical protein
LGFEQAALNSFNSSLSRLHTRDLYTRDLYTRDLHTRDLHTRDFRTRDLHTRDSKSTLNRALSSIILKHSHIHSWEFAFE